MLPSQYRFCTHCQILGSIGSGKSSYCRFCIKQHVAQGNGFALIDYKNLVDEVIADLCVADCRKKIWYLNLSSGEPSTWNPFRLPEGASIAAHSRRLASAIVSAWREDKAKMPNYRKVIQAVLTFCMETGEPLQHGLELLQRENTAIRHWAYAKLQDAGAKRTILKMQDASSKNADWTWLVGSTESRLADFCGDPAIVRCIGLPDSVIDIPRIRRNGEILLVSIRPSDQLSDDSARIIAALLTSEFLHDSLESEERPYYLYLDEPQEYVTKETASMLNLSRHSGLRVTLIYHHPGEGLFADDQPLNDSIETNCRIKCLFAGLPLHFAKHYAESIFLDGINKVQVMAERQRRYVDYDYEQNDYGRHAIPEVLYDEPDEIYWPRDEKVGQAASRVMNLPDRTCWIKTPKECYRFNVPFISNWKRILDAGRLAKFNDYLTVKARAKDDADELITTEYDRFTKLTGGERAPRRKKPGAEPPDLCPR